LTAKIQKKENKTGYGHKKVEKRNFFSRLMRQLWQGSDGLLQYGLGVATTPNEKH
jgi:hypothetical protein